MAKKASPSSLEASEKGGGTWIKHHPPYPRPSTWRAWMGRSWVSPDRRVFINSKFAGERSILSASWDGVEMMTDGDEVYLPIDWFIKEERDAENKKIFEDMRERILETSYDV